MSAAFAKAPRLTVLDDLPDAWLGLDAVALARELDGPTLVHLPGQRPEPLLVATLLHGNETSGWDALRRWLPRAQPLPRALSMFIGNVYAAREGLRRFDSQPDYNRIWGLEPVPDEAPETALAREVVEVMRARKVFAAIDLHNTSGRNPHYGIVHSLDAATLGLTQFFARRVLHSELPERAFSTTFAALCPALTLEAGMPGEHRGVAAMESFLQSCIRLEALPGQGQRDVQAELIDGLAVYRMALQVRVAEGLSVGFGTAPGDVRFDADLDRYNFQQIPAGTVIGEVEPGVAQPLRFGFSDAADGGGDDRSAVAERFMVERGKLLTTRPIIPVMLTTDARIVRQDCLCYLMEVVNL